MLLENVRTRGTRSTCPKAQTRLLSACLVVSLGSRATSRLRRNTIVPDLENSVRAALERAGMAARADLEVLISRVFTFSYIYLK